ncbi:MAG: hypothetical protein Q9195_008156 [Heterodermia aff. obscurata]
MASTPASRLLSREKLAGWVPPFTDLVEHSPSFDTLAATVQNLRDSLNQGHLRSTQLVEEYQRSICLHNEWLGAVYQLAPGAMDRAREMDAMRQEGKILGVPVFAVDGLQQQGKPNLRTYVEVWTGMTVLEAIA